MQWRRLSLRAVPSSRTNSGAQPRASEQRQRPSAFVATTCSSRSLPRSPIDRTRSRRSGIAGGFAPRCKALTQGRCPVDIRTCSRQRMWSAQRRAMAATPDGSSTPNGTMIPITSSAPPFRCRSAVQWPMPAAFTHETLSRRWRDAHQCLAEVAAFQHTDEGGRRILEAVSDILPIADAAIGDSGGDRAQEGRVVLGEFVVDVAAQSEALAQHLTHGCGKKIWSGSGSGCVILGDQPAHRHARKCVEQGQYGLPDGSPDVFEIEIDPVRAGSRELLGKVRRTMIDSGIEAKFFDDSAAFFGAAADADRARGRQLRELPDQ